jgi:hypothetical protein
MVAAVVAAVGVMLVAAGPISDFVNRHPSVKMLALSFLLLIGASLVAEGFDHHIPKGYVYGPIAFSVFVEALNLRAGSRTPARKKEPVHLRPYIVKTGTPGQPLPGPDQDLRAPRAELPVRPGDPVGSSDGGPVQFGQDPQTAPEGAPTDRRRAG